MRTLNLTIEVAQELVANPDEVTTTGEVTIPILANDTFRGEPVTLGDLAGPPTITHQPESGSSGINSNGELVYTPEPGFVGTVTLQYMIEVASSECSEAGFGDNSYTNYIGVPPAWVDDSSEATHYLYFSNSEDPVSEGKGVWYIYVEVQTYGWGGMDITRLSDFGDVPYSHYEDPPNVVSGFVVEYGETTQVQCAEISLQENAPQ